MSVVRNGGDSNDIVQSQSIPNEPIRHFMLFVDGTWVSATTEAIPDSGLSNVYRLAVATNTNAATTDGQYEAQIAFYLAGIGSPARGRKYSGGAFAPDLALDVEHAYANVCLNYIPNMNNGVGDKIYLLVGHAAQLLRGWWQLLLPDLVCLSNRNLTIFRKFGNMSKLRIHLKKRNLRSGIAIKCQIKLSMLRSAFWVFSTLS